MKFIAMIICVVSGFHLIAVPAVEASESGLEKLHKILVKNQEIKKCKISVSAETVKFANAEIPTLEIVVSRVNNGTSELKTFEITIYSAKYSLTRATDRNTDRSQGEIFGQIEADSLDSDSFLPPERLIVSYDGAGKIQFLKIEKMVTYLDGNPPKPQSLVYCGN